MAITTNAIKRPNITNSGKRTGAISGRECARTSNAIFFVKFLQWEAASINTIDYVGVLCFIGACLLLFASLPFLDFIEWSRTQKRFFYRVFIIPMLFLFILFSLKFLIPGNAYQKLFFPGYKEKEEKEKVYFNMKKYEIKEPDKEENK